MEQNIFYVICTRPKNKDGKQCEFSNSIPMKEEKMHRVKQHYDEYSEQWEYYIIKVDLHKEKAIVKNF